MKEMTNSVVKVIRILENVFRSCVMIKLVPKLRINISSCHLKGKLVYFITSNIKTSLKQFVGVGVGGIYIDTKP